ncbi:hypothetical protein vBPaerPsCh_127 [Pseudomonas phage vB_Paer_PsCh]|uniref:Uncharacterized protein n=1 Tax=Pseudomonas phage vB_Paer_PsCh TaxID=2924906 RepID=A0AAE9KEC6_9CAUD|nr:hypothetical protein QE349_gp127 [Pseudomonas phage vB_Paer_PsCh]UOL47958.1 hypothetical protein vBPaerPsCh_127 [Pseudomonas phage vB_Paer_PsCh]
MSNAPVWTTELEKASAAEGWSVFDTEGSDNGPYQIQRIDDPEAYEEATGELPPRLESDVAAWLLVFNGKGLHHAAAKEFIAHHNPKEWAAIVEYCQQGDVL